MMLSMAETLSFIDDYREQRVLWDTNHDCYLSPKVRLVSLRILSKKYSADIKSIKAKIKSLRTYFSKEHQKLMQKRHSGHDSYTNYKSRWFAYTAMSFLLDLESKTNKTPKQNNREANIALLDKVKPPKLKKIGSLSDMGKNDTLSFIEDYYNQQLLWDKNHKDYHHSGKRDNALYDLCQTYSANIIEVKQKIKSLRSYFQREHQKVLKNRLQDEDYKSTWFGYNPLLFLADIVDLPKNIQMNNLFNFETDIHLESDDELDEENNSDYECCESDLQFHEKTTQEQVETTPEQIKKRKFCPIEEDCYHETEFSPNDECTLFGQYIGAKMQKLSTQSQMIAQNKIMTWLLDLQMKDMEACKDSNGLKNHNIKCDVSSMELNDSNDSFERSPEESILTENTGELITIKVT